MRLIIKNGTLVSPSETWEADLLIEDGRIVSIGRDLTEEGAEVIDAEGQYVIPGGIDVHTHMDLQAGASRAVDDFYDGTVGAACGGTTAIVDHMAFGPKGCNLHHQLNEYHRLAEGKAVIDYGFHGVVQHVDDEILDELEAMAEEGVPSTKVYLTYDGRLNDAEAFLVLKKMKELGGVTAFHCENHELVEYGKKSCRMAGNYTPEYHAKSRPNLVEAEAVSRVLALARLAGDAPVYIVHISCKESMDAIREAKREGQKNIYTESCPQYFLLTEDRYRDADGLKYVMSPPLRSAEDCAALWDCLAAGEIDIVATDHCPFRYEKEKQLGKDDFTKCPNGAPGVEERMSVMFSEGVMKGRITVNQYVETMCANPAKVYGLYPEKGALLPGSDADIVLIDPNRSYVLTHERMHGAADYTAYEGMEIQGEITTVLSKGKVVAKDNTFTGEKGAGAFIRRKANK